MNKKTISTLQISLLICMNSVATCPSTPTVARFTQNSTEILDRHTGLLWDRCSVGQSWDGNGCSGDAKRLTHEESLKYAKSKAPYWRLPNIRELVSLVDTGCENLMLDSIAFPNTPKNPYYWSSTPMAYDSQKAFMVSFGDGTLDAYIINGRSNKFFVRLVRAGNGN